MMQNITLRNSCQTVPSLLLPLPLLMQIYGCKIYELDAIMLVYVFHVLHHYPFGQICVEELSPYNMYTKNLLIISYLLSM